MHFFEFTEDSLLLLQPVKYNNRINHHCYMNNVKTNVLQVTFWKYSAFHLANKNNPMNFKS